MDYAYISDKGLARENNEDYILINDKLTVFLLADGMGGHSAGEIASEKACRFLMEYISSRSDRLKEDPRELLKESLEVANKHVLFLANEEPEYNGMGTTMVVLYLEGRRYIIAGVGDSRAYKYSSGELLKLTKDHSLVQEMVDDGIISSEEAKTHKLRNVITQSLGMQLEVEPCFAEGELKDEEVILLSTDGLHDYVDMEFVRKTIEANDISEVANKLIQIANEKGGNDNCSVVLVKV